MSCRKGHKEGASIMVHDKGTESRCKGCGAVISEAEEGNEYCSRCMIERAEGYVPEAKPPQPLPKKKRVSSSVYLLLILVATIITVMQIPRLVVAIKEQPPLRYGTYETDAATDQCIANLWRIARILQDGKTPGKEIVCPVSKKAYIIRKIKGDVVASCPNPELHELSRLEVSKMRPVPEVSK